MERARPWLSRMGAPRDTLRLTKLSKAFFPGLGLTKSDLLGYYAAIAPALLPHLQRRAMVMKRSPDGITCGFFYIKRTPTARPEGARGRRRNQRLPSAQHGGPGAPLQSPKKRFDLGRYV